MRLQVVLFQEVKSRIKANLKKSGLNMLSDVCLFVWLVAQRPSNILVYLRDGCAQIVVRAATLT